MPDPPNDDPHGMANDEGCACDALSAGAPNFGAHKLGEITAPVTSPQSP
ncbi:MAG: hypothetical protein ABJO41_04210 [Erythrobacter sp.]